MLAMELDEWEFISEGDELRDQIQLSPRRHQQVDAKDLVVQDLNSSSSDTVIHTDYFQLRSAEENVEEGDDDVDPIDGREVAVEEEVDSISRFGSQQPNLLVFFHPAPSYPRPLISPEVLFKKPSGIIEINQFADMKLDSAKSINNNKATDDDVVDAAPVSFFSSSSEAAAVVADNALNKLEVEKDDLIVPPPTAPAMVDVAAQQGGGEFVCRSSSEGGGQLNLWKMGTTGLGAVCSFGFACATTMCIVILGSRGGGGRKMTQQKQKLHFQIYTTDKRMMMMQDAVMVRRAAAQVSSAMRGGGAGYSSRAEITVGGYYDAHR